MLTEHNGTQFDAAIATLFCEGAAVHRNEDVGGDFNIRYVDGISSSSFLGEAKTYIEMYQKYGRVPWRTLIQPTIDLCCAGDEICNWKLAGTLEIIANGGIDTMWGANETIARLHKKAAEWESVSESSCCILLRVSQCCLFQIFAKHSWLRETLERAVDSKKIL